MDKKEIYWLAGTLLAILIFYFVMFGSSGFSPGSHNSVNIHDTYFVFETFHLLFLISVLLFFIVYMIRAVVQKFRNPTVNRILIIFSIILVFVFSFLYFSMNESI